MNIYFVNRNSKWRGPLDVIDAKQRHIIHIGDICIRDTGSCLNFLVVNDNKNTWTSCKNISNGHNNNFSKTGNTLLFSFDGITKRCGNLILLKSFVDCFNNKRIVDFLSNAIDILEYKKDLWEFDVFQQLFFTSSLPVSEQKKEKVPDTDRHTHISSGNYPSIFASYFDDNIINRINVLLNEGKSLRETYTEIRNEEPELFRSSLLIFLKENPGKTIYDTYPQEADKELEPKETTSEWYLSSLSYINENSNIIGHSTCFNKDKYLDENSSDSLRRYFNQISNYHILSDDEVFKLFKRYHSDDLNALDLLVKSHQELVVEIAFSFYIIKKVPLEDLIQEGNIGLIRAIEKFDYLRFRSFSYYAKLRISQAIIDATIYLPYIVRLPLNQFVLYQKIRRFKENFEQQNGYPPSGDDIDIGENVELNRMNFLCQLPYDLKDITFFVDDYDSFESDTNMPDKGLIEESTRIYVQGLLSLLSKKEGQILQAYYGLNGTPPESLEQIAERQRLSRERIRQIKEKSVRIIRVLYDSLKKGNGDDFSSSNEITLKHNVSIEERIEHRVTIPYDDIIVRQHYFPQISDKDVDEKGTSYYSEYLCMLTEAQVPEEQKCDLKVESNPSKDLIIPELAQIQQEKTLTLADRISQILHQYNGPISLKGIVSKVNQKYMAARPESVDYILRSMSDVECTQDGRYQLKRIDQAGYLRTSEGIDTRKRINISRLPIKTSLNKTATAKFNLSTTIDLLVEQKILTRKERKQCKHKGIRTIDDVKRKIEKYNLTRSSTRFTQYTINLWFKIIDLLSSDPFNKD